MMAHSEAKFKSNGDKVSLIFSDHSGYKMNQTYFACADFIVGFV